MAHALWEAHHELEGQLVSVDSTTGRRHTGVLLAVDPELGSTIVLREGGEHVDVVLGHAVRAVRCVGEAVQGSLAEALARLEHDTGLHYGLHGSNACEDGQDDGEHGRVDGMHGQDEPHYTADETIAYLARVRIPAQACDAGVSVLRGAATIVPPFRSCDCRSTNGLVLQRVQEVLRRRAARADA